MAAANCTPVTNFILVGFSKHSELRLLLIFLFLLIYTLILLGNISMIVLIRADPCLSSPMYFFLMNLSILDLCYASVIAPKVLANLLVQSRTISYSGCAAQMFFFSVFVATEGVLLAVMAYDRFHAICYPLQYQVSMSRNVCMQLVLGSYFCGCLNSSIHTSLAFRLDFCGPNEIYHFFCDLPALLKLSQSDTSLNEVVMIIVSASLIVSTILVILISYAYIVSTILRIRSREGRYKAFSTCASHMTAVALFYATVFFMYALPSAVSSPGENQVVSVFYTLVIPMLNPMIYSLRNKDVKEALKRRRGWKCHL
ncbi:olfactory receptor 1052-like [Alligator mississippiensis]|uniref:olfactory receptor 1052-like n=1 Tax=Alligator mississippiensis TaxID=8496 RepID=UPI0003D0CB9F|nr:olfactory receptor 1052-like [Alligator mississippiensis]